MKRRSRTNKHMILNAELGFVFPFEAVICSPGFDLLPSQKPGFFMS